MTDEEVVEPVVEEVVESVVEPEEVVEPHPLEPGGKRFQEVYGDWRKEQSARERAEAELAVMRSQQQAPRQQSPVQYTSEQVDAYLQQQVDQGQMTPMRAANLMSQFNAQKAATQITIQAEQVRQLGSKLQNASVEVNQFMDRVPALKDTNSADFRRVSDAAYRVSDDMGLPVSDLRVQRTALREVYGSLEKMAKDGEGRESSRRASLPHVETSAGGTRQPSALKEDAWKKDVPERYMTFWKERGYSEQRMKDEAKYIKPRAAK